MNNNKRWIIWSIEHDAWWKPAERGYTKERREAGVYSFEKACEIVSRGNLMLNDEPNEAMVEYVDMEKADKDAEDTERSDEWDERHSPEM